MCAIKIKIFGTYIRVLLADHKNGETAFCMFYIRWCMILLIEKVVYFSSFKATFGNNTFRQGKSVFIVDNHA